MTTEMKYGIMAEKPCGRTEMTKSEIYSAVRNILNEQSEDAGAFLKGESNLADFVNDATEQVVLAFSPTCPAVL